MYSFCMHAQWTLRDFKEVSAILIVLIIILNIAMAAAGISPATIFIFLVLQETAFIAPIWLVILLKYKGGLKILGLRAMPVREALLWTIKGLGLLVIVTFILSALTAQFGDIPGFANQGPIEPIIGAGVVNRLIAAIVIVGIAPVIEEIFFRGFVLQSLALRFSPHTASIVSALVFALIHLQINSAGLIFVLGLILNWIFMRSGSLIPAILFHMVNNGLAFAIEFS